MERRIRFDDEEAHSNVVYLRFESIFTPIHLVGNKFTNSNISIQIYYTDSRRTPVDEDADG